MRTTESDSGVIRRSLTEPVAFEELFERYFYPIYKYARRRIGGDFAQDVVCEVFLRAFSKRRSFDLGRESARPWLFGIANNVVREFLTTRARTNRPLPLIADPSHEPFEDVVSRLDAEQLRGSIRDSLGLLSNADLEVLLLYALSDLSYEEISDALEIPVGTVRSRLFRARRILRPELDARSTSGSASQRRPT